MVQLFFQNMQFHDREGVIPSGAPKKVFLQNWSVTLFLDMKKNSITGESTAMEATKIGHRNPVLDGGRRFLHLRQHNAYPNTPI